MKEKFLIFGMASIYPRKYNSNVWRKRELDYFLSIKSIINLHVDTDLYIFDNSINSIDKIFHSGLKQILLEKIENYPVLISKFIGASDIYKKNNDKGFIELLKYSGDYIEQFAKDNNYITILNLRRYFLSSMWFHLIEELLYSNKYEILVMSNKQTELKNMKIICEKDVPISDSIFTMRKDLFLEYIDFLRSVKFPKVFNSDNILWEFIKEKRFYLAENVGIMRNEWNVNNQNFALSNMKFS